MKKIINTAILSVCICAPATSGAQQVGQTNPDPKMQAAIAPTGQGLGNIFSPNLFDGSATVSIPIYPYEAGGISCGVSISYHTKGVKLDQAASALGLNFSLVAGGSIMRSVRDMPDELNLETGDTIEIPTSPASSSLMMVPAMYHRYRGKYVAYGESSADSADTRVYRDRETDEFIVSAGSLSFSFQLGPGGAIYTHPQSNARIEPLIDGNTVNNVLSQTNGRYESAQLLGFRITDVAGNRFYFVRGDYERRYIMDEYSGTAQIMPYYVTTRWDLEKIVLASGSEVRYSYRQSSAMTLPVYNQNLQYEGSYVPGYQSAEIYGETRMPYSYFSEITAIQYPDNTRADFIYDVTDRCDYMTSALRQIRISGGANCLRYAMEQSYFVAIHAGADSARHSYGHCYSVSGPPDPLFSKKYQRLRLDGIRMLSCDSSLNEPYYSFDYDTARLPPRMDGRQDFFGFYNGDASGVPDYRSIPSHIRWGTGGAFTGRNRSVNAGYAKASMLTTIRNSFGGSLTFYYGPHSLSNAGTPAPGDSYFMGGSADDGLRVDSTREEDIYHPGNAKITHYDYSGGRRFIPGGYFHYPDIMADGTDSVTQIVMGGSYVSPHQLIAGSNHGYSQVNVSVTTQSNALLSRTIISYTNMNDGGLVRYYKGSGKHYYEFPYADKQYLLDWQIGLPKSVSEYDQNDRLLRHRENYYHYDTTIFHAISNTRAARVKRKGQYYAAPLNSYLQLREITDHYSPYTGRAVLDSVVTRSYVSDSRFVADTVRYTYDSHRNLKTTLQRSSEGILEKTVNIYNYDISGGSGAIASMNGAGLEKLLSVQRWYPGATTASDRLVDVSASGMNYGATLLPKNTYALENNLLSYGQYVPNPSDPYRNLDTVFNGNTVRYLKKLTEISLYDAKGAPLESQLMDVNSYKAMIWDTATGQKLAEAANCRYTDIAYTSFETEGLAYSNFSYNPSTAVFAADGVSGTRCFRLNDLLGGNTSLSGSQDLQQGKAYVLSFWSKGPDPLVKIGSTALSLPAPVIAVGSWRNYMVRFTPGASAQRVSITGTGGGSYLDEVRLQPEQASMQSFTYQPLFGQSSVTAPNGRITYTEYDKLGRPVLVRDQDGHILSKTEYAVQGDQ